jgi:Family of unknown function (DUF6364)
MTTKLTLVIDRKNVSAAKKIARQNRTSVSAMVNGFFERLQYIEAKARQEPVHPVVKQNAGSFGTGHKNIMKELFGR